MADPEPGREGAKTQSIGVVSQNAARDFLMCSFPASITMEHHTAATQIRQARSRVFQADAPSTVQAPSNMHR